MGLPHNHISKFLANNLKNLLHGYIISYEVQFICRSYVFTMCLFTHVYIFLRLLRKYKNDQNCLSLGLTLLLFFSLKMMQKFLLFLFLLNNGLH